MPGFRLKWDGPRASAIVRRRLAEDLARLGRNIHRRARAECPVDTGELRDSHQLIIDARGIRIVERATAEHGLWVHEGTSRQRANPWMQRAIDAEVATFRFSTG